MADQRPATPSLIPAFLALLVLILFGYLLFVDLEPSSRTEHTLPPIEIVDPEPAVTIIDPEPEIPSGEEIVEQEAQAFVEALTQETPEGSVITITEDEDVFVRHDSVVSLPELEHRSTSIDQLLADESLADDAPITIHYTTEDHIKTTLAELNDSIDDHIAPITIATADGETITASLAEFLSRNKIDVNAPITHIKLSKHSKQVTPKELAELELNANQELIATINHGIQEIFIKEIIQSNDLPDNALFYLHRVTERDKQGLWGIIQAGLIGKFRQGIAVEGISHNKDFMQVTIPADADETLPTGSSSFLGKALNNKVKNSHIYNLTTHTMGYDPNIIHPGQQLILIHFSAQELKHIYQFFSEKRNQNTETFAISN